MYSSNVNKDKPTSFADAQICFIYTLIFLEKPKLVISLE